MGLANDLKSEIRKTFKANWQTRQGRVVPTVADLKLDNDGVEVEATVLYADLADSTGLVRDTNARFAAEVYKAYLTAACRVVRANDGTITAFDGDRVMAVFMGDTGASAAAASALQIAWAVDRVVNPALADLYPEKTYRVRQAVGIDKGKMLVAKTGVRGSSDLVWTGLAANRAAKLCALRTGNLMSWISPDVFAALDDSVRYGGNPRRHMWTNHPWPDQGINVYGSNWTWELPE
jgi:class 3 adenylate cyclase